jgi:ubiquinone/menaquinone biosynthesis C-methylase UbiE
MTTALPAVDYSTVKARQQKTWASGDYSVVASRIVLLSELLADSADLRAGSHVLDVACGNGNTTLAAARAGTHAVGVDYVPHLLEGARQRALTEGLDARFVLGDAEDLPAEDSSFDAVISALGVMFAPDHRRAADEIVRVARPGATVALASWRPTGLIGEVFRTISSHVPAPPGLRSPMLWGTEEHLRELFGDVATSMRSAERTLTFRHTSPEDFVAFFRRWYGPAVKAFDALDGPGQTSLASDLADLARRFDSHADGGSVAMPATYLETVITLR